MRPKHCLFLLALIVAGNAVAQTAVLYRLTFTNKDNFSIITDGYRLANGHHPGMPQTLLIMDTTQTWFRDIFWPAAFDEKGKQAAINEMKNEEHGPYNAYLFKDAALDKQIADRTKQQLGKACEKIRSHRIKLSGRGYHTITSAKKIKGYYLVTTQPLFSPDGQYAFMYLSILHKDRYRQPVYETWYATVTLVFRKQGKTWKRIAKMDWLIL